MKGGGDGSDVRRLDRQQRYKVPTSAQAEEDLTPDYMNLLGILLSMIGIMMRFKWCAWVALYCSCVSFANTKVNDNAKQLFSSFMLSICSIIMAYLQSPQPMSPPWATSFSP